MNNFFLILKGFIIGIAKIMPGVSGAILSISFGVYERILYIISHPFKVKFDDLKFLFFLLIGAVLGIVLLCDFIKWCLIKYYFSTMCIFIGLIFGGISEITSEIKSFKLSYLFLFIISFCLVSFLTSLGSGGESSSNHYFMMGFIESATTIIPGISGTAIFMALGWYGSLLGTIKGVLTFSAEKNVSFYFLSGFIVSTIIISWFITFAFKKCKSEYYVCVLGFMCASLFGMVFSLLDYFSIFNLLFGLLLFSLGYMITYKLNNIFSNF